MLHNAFCKTNILFAGRKIVLELQYISGEEKGSFYGNVSSYQVANIPIFSTPRLFLELLLRQAE